jgi:DNA-binding transcriptional regulator PaaX
MNKITRDETEHGVEYVRADEAQAEVLEQCRIIAMGAEREDALRAELTRLKASIALDKMAENARDLGLDYEPAVQEPVAWVNHGENRITRATGWDGYGALCKCVCANPPAAQPAVQEKCFLCGERVASCTSDVCPKSAQPAVQEGRDWSLLEATQESLREHMAEIKRLKAAQPEIKLKGKNHG